MSQIFDLFNFSSIKHHSRITKENLVYFFIIISHVAIVSHAWTGMENAQNAHYRDASFAITLFSGRV